MDLEVALLKEHSKAQCNKVVAYVGNSKERFAQLMKLFFDGDYRVTQRAAWPMSYCVRNHPKLIDPYFKKLIDKLGRPGENDAVIRNTVRLLQGVEIPEKYHGQIMTLCFNFIQSNETAVAIKAFSLTILKNLSQKYPEIIGEIKTIIEERWEFETAAFRARAKSFLGERKHKIQDPPKESFGQEPRKEEKYKNKKGS